MLIRRVTFSFTARAPCRFGNSLCSSFVPLDVAGNKMATGGNPPAWEKRVSLLRAQTCEQLWRFSNRALINNHKRVIRTLLKISLSQFLREDKRKKEQKNGTDYFCVVIVERNICEWNNYSVALDCLSFKQHFDDLVLIFFR